ncbi:MAG TPA: sigma-E factor regulatory protein RseB domain-containing protein [Actinomycetota bacterium]|nr:sigma-E factor regulatory protein RseB domain-containing protein [Actinomycetota bacterium]
MIPALIAGVLSLALVLPGAPAPSPPSPPDAQAVLNLAVAGARSVDYEGTQQVMVRGEHGIEVGTLKVARGGDQMMIESQASPGWVVVQDGNQRSSMGLNGGSASVSEAELSANIEPSADVAQLLQKYAVALEGTVQMLQRSAWVLRIERSSDLRLIERWTVDAVTGLILQRQSFDDQGQIERSITFTSVQEPFTPPPSALSPPIKASAPAQEFYPQAQVTGFAHSAGLPATLPGGYRLRAGARFTAGRTQVDQLVYSDGLEVVSLFQQPGALSRSSVPASARKVGLAHESGYLWETFPRRAAWQAGPNTDTLLGASPSDEFQTIANALPQAPIGHSLMSRLRHLVDWVEDRL